MAIDLVSVIMPVFNAESHVAEAINSVLNQSHVNLELIAVDDASTDNSFKKICGFQDDRLRCIRLEKNGGAGRARNEGIQIAEGRFIAFIDADDIWLNEKLTAQIDFMQQTDVAFSYTDYYLMNEESKFTHQVTSPPSVDYGIMKKNNYIGCLTAMYDAHKLGKIFMPERRKRQDWALWLEILKKTDRAEGLPNPLAGYRRTENSLSRNKWGLMRENYRFYREVLGYNTLVSGICFAQFLCAYSWYKLISVKSID
jgi:glycosyltransferase involved in cell wall biosynthesis